ncbi:hypothetical protein P43SY_009065 [Pythium insidiosum]|uniref:PDZ domain-containing protein n=1 Tax=Pythium insidiosum TaxID=114742 RepID=A0AAD5LP28_PYTIN|nr:hypothetical protein P43SY_009065 [Pythium insidiosum]
MNDPFAAFDPINNRPKTAATAGSFATLPTPVPLAAPAAGPYNQFNGASMAPGNNGMVANPFGGMTMQPSGANSQLKPIPSGASFMTQPSGTPGFAMGLSAAPPTAMNMFGGAPAPAMAPAPAGNSNPFGAQPIMYDSIKNLLQPKPVDPFATNNTAPMTTAPAPRPPPAPLTTQTSTIIDFDPFSPRDATPRSPFDNERTGSGGASALADRQQSKRQTQDATRSQLSFDSSAFQQHASSASSTKVSLTSLARQDSSKSAGAARPATTPFDDGPFFSDNSDAFAGQTVSNLDDDFFSPPPANATANVRAQGEEEEDAVSAECPPGEYDVTFDSGRKLGVLMERVDVWGGKREERRQESAVVKLVVENGAADRVGVTIGSSVVAINGRSVANASYTSVLELIKSVPRPMTVRFKRGTVNKDTTQGNILTRISNGTFSVGNFTSGNATWTPKYFAFGGAKMDVLQLFVSRAAYHECVISLYEKRAVHTQIQSFRLCRDHKISPIKTKIYKGYGNLHYFSLTVPSLRFVAAKFASEDYETVKNIWSNTYDAIERKKRMGY